MPKQKISDLALAELAKDQSQKLDIVIDGRTIETGQHVGVAGAQKAPGIVYTVPDPSAKYIIVSLDLDAPFPSWTVMSPILHWIQPGLTADSNGKLVVTEPFVANWLPPAPPPRSGPHRYAFYLFKQPTSFEGHRYAPANGQPLGLWPRIRFSLDDWMKKAGLSDPIAANYFVSN